jgi:uncharacterized protein (TIGR02145 family)
MIKNFTAFTLGLIFIIGTSIGCANVLWASSRPNGDILNPTTFTSEKPVAFTSWEKNTFSGSEHFLASGRLEDYSSSKFGSIPSPQSEAKFDIVQKSVSDIDGNVYTTVVIGEQEWMVENLRVTKYRNGDLIDMPSSWLELTTGAIKWYSNDQTTYGDIYGALYNWYAANDSRGLCPTGWHVPTDEEFTSLEDYLISQGVTASAQALAANNYWNTSVVVGAPGYDLVSNNSTGFSAVPAGVYDPNDVFYSLGGYNYLWTSTENTSNGYSWVRRIDYNATSINRLDYGKGWGYSVRCIKDQFIPELVADYPLNGDANDQTANANHGTSTSFIPTANRFGEAGNALYFDASNPVSVPSSEVMSFGTNDFTIGFWFTLNDLDRWHNGLIGRNDFEGIALEYNHDQDHRLTIWANAEGSSGWDLEWKPNYNVWESNVWYYLVLKREATSLILYINGQPVENTTIDISVANPSTDFYIGRSQLEDRTHLGKMDDVKIFNYALTDAEIGTYYNEGNWDNLNGSLQAYYPFNGNTDDESGNGNSPTFSSVSPVADRFNIENSAVALNGVDSYIQIPHSTSLDFTGEISVSVWINPSQVNIEQQTISSKGGGWSRAGWLLTLINDKVRWHLGDGTSEAIFDTETSIPANKWSHIVATWKDGVMSVYINGVLDNASASWAGGLVSNTYDHYIGKNDNIDFYFNGMIDDERVYSRAIDDLEILQLYANFDGPELLVAEPGDGSITLKWSSEGIENISQYNIYQDANFVGSISVGSPTDTTYTIQGLNNHQFYQFHIVSVDIWGNYSQPSNPLIKKPSATSLIDINGNVYPTVIIGNQEWMAQNLMATTFANGEAIPRLDTNEDWSTAGGAAYSVYPLENIEGIANELGMLSAYGSLYNAHSVTDARGLCPDGWHIPLDAEWQELLNYVGGADVAGGNLKSIRVEPDSHPRWASPNIGATDQYGFSALPAGARSFDGSFYHIGLNAFFWIDQQNSAEKNVCAELAFDIDDVLSLDYEVNHGLSVRCIKDRELPTLTTSDISEVSASTATSGGDISSDGGSSIIIRGIVWSTSENPTLETNDGFTQDGAETGQYVSQMVELIPNTVYYVRAYATNSLGTSYGNQLSFTTLEGTAPVLPEGDGTESTPYLIASLNNLLWLTENYAHWDKYYLQTADINASGTETWNDGQGWSPIGNNSYVFTGNYDGNSHSITGLYINRPGYDYMGMFGIASTAVIKNLKLLSANVAGESSTGALIGHTSEATIQNCFAEGTVKGSFNLGGLIGNLNTGNDLTDCASLTTVEGNYNVGGLVGSAYLSSISRCSSNSNIVVSNYRVGGLVGDFNNSTLEHSFSKGVVTGTYYLGGLVGSSYNISSISNCYSLSDIQSTEWGKGGLVGENNNSSIVNCYAAGHILQEGSSNGLVGYDVSGSVTNSFWDAETTGCPYTGQNASIWGTGLTSAQMKLKSTYENASWSFVAAGGDEIWNIGNGRNFGYPYLKWEFPADPADNPPVLTTSSVVIVSESEVTVSGTIEFLGDPSPTQHGFCYGNNFNPTLEDLYVELGTPNQTGAFSAQLTGLETDLFFARAFAVTANGVYYGNSISFIPYSAPQGTGALDDPYLITSLGNLYWLSETSEHWDKHYLQTADIDASSTANWNGGAGFKPIGTDSAPFTGTYNGGGNTISYLYVDNPDLNRVGMFGYVTGSDAFQYSLQNLSLASISVSGGEFVGGLVGFIESIANVRGCFVSGNVNGKYGYIGGIAGHTHNMHLDEVGTNVTVTGQNYSGGLVGSASWQVVISNSFARGQVFGNEYVGGVAGFVEHSVFNSYSSVAVSGSNYVGGLVGSNGTEATSTNSYFDTQVATTTYSALGIGRTTDQMSYPYDANTYENWDFENIWGVDADFTQNNGYPFLLANYLPTINTVWPKDLLSTSVKTGGEVIVEGQAAVNSRGVVWATFPNPTVDNNEEKIEDGNGIGSFSVTAENLTPNTVYYLRAFATNSFGTSYGKEFDVKTFAPGGSVSDNEGNLYPTIQIGDQVWMAKNLGVKHYNNGDEIPTGFDYNGWVNATEGAFTIYDYTQVAEVSSEQEMLNDFGALYNSYAVTDTRGLCPVGWRVPSSDDWTALEGAVDTDYDADADLWNNYDYRGSDVGYKLKSQLLWLYDNNGDDAFGFRALPSGDFSGNAYGFHERTAWWCSNDNVIRQLSYNSNQMGKYTYEPYYGLSVRCVKTNSVLTAEANEVTPNTAKVEVTIVDNGFNVQSRGLVWGTSPKPTVESNYDLFTEEAGIGTFQVLLENLDPNTTYYARGTAVVDGVMEYGNEISFTTSIPVEDFAGGSGTVEDPYLVANAAQLNNVRNYRGSHFLQVADIDLSGPAWTNNEGWDPIGEYGYDQNYTANFYGTYDGGFYSINNLTINRPTKSFVGLFGSIWSIDGNIARIKNLKLKNVNIIGDGAVGGLAGNADLECVVEYCSVEGSIQGNYGIGGLAGKVENGGRIKACYFNGNVSSASGSNVGGLVGYVAGYVENSYARGNVSGTDRVGGLLGTIWWGEIINCYSTAQVSASSDFGGLVGYPQWDNNPVFTNSYWDYETSGVYSTVAGEGRYTDDMTYAYASNTYVDWDFAEIWGEDTEYTINNGYPFLKAIAFGSPSLTTEPITEITSRTAISGGNITSDGGDAVSARGVVWSTEQNPSLENNLGFTDDGSGTGTYVSELVGLIPNAAYYVRAYATNNHGTAYGNQIQFTTLPDKEVPDVKMFNSPLVIGTNDERWNMIAPNFIDKGNATLDNNSSYWKMGWDVDKVYVRVVISDDNFCDQWCTGYDDQNWMADRIELYFNVSGNLNPPDDHGVNPELENDFYLGYHQNTSQFQYQVTQLDRTLTNMYPHYTDYYHAYSVEGTNITYEFEIPWSSLVAQDVPFSPADGKEFGFDVKYKDWDNAQETGESNWWSEFSMGWDQINTIGSVILSAQTVEGESTPIVITSEISDITENSAMSGGEISYNGGSDVTAKGIVWSTSQFPTLENNLGFTNSGSGVDAFEGQLTNLTPNTTYFVRAYATNSIGTGYGQERVFITSALSAFTVYFSNPEYWDEVYIWLWGGDGSFTDIWPGEPMSAPEEGSIWYSFDVPPAYTALLFNNNNNGLKTIDLLRDREGWFDGVQWYDQEPFNTQGTIADADGNLYRTVIIGEQVWMEQNLKTTKYSDGSAIESGTDIVWYDNNENFKHIYGALYSGYAVTDAKGLCPDGWKVPTLDDINVLIDYLGGANLAGGKLKSTGTIPDGTGIWESPNTNATNDTGFKGVPGGYVGGAMNQAGYWWLNTLTTIESENDAAFHFALNYNSADVVTYAYALSNLNSIRCLRTTPATEPILQTIQVSDITPTSAKSGGEFTQGDNVTEKGVVWSLTAEPTLEDYIGKTIDGAGDNAFASEIAGLSPETTYYVRAYAVNNLGTGYGQVEEFTTLPPSAPVLSTKPVTLLSATSAKSGGVIISDGASPITSKGIVWSSSQNPSLESNEGITNSGSGNDEFESQMTGLNPGSLYYVRAFAINDVGTSYGDEVSFSTAQSLTFKVVSQSGSAISGASITLDAEALTTDFNGNAIFYRPDGTYSYLVEANNYFPVSGEVTVSGQSVDVKLKLIAEGASTSQIVGERTVCQGSELIYTITGSTGGTWEIVGGTIVEDISSNVMVRWTSTNGNGVIGYRTVDNDGYIQVNQALVTVNSSTSITEQDKPDIYKKGHLNILICTTPSTSYKWYRNGDQIDGQSRQYYVAGQQSGNYRVQVLTDQCPHTSNALDVSGTANADVALTAFPNPSNGQVTLAMEFGTESNSLLSISNAFGVVLYKEVVPAMENAFEHRLSLEGMAPGVYVVTLRINGDIPLTTKLTIQ